MQRSHISIKGVWDRVESKKTIAAFFLLFILASVLFRDRNFLGMHSLQNMLRKCACDGGYAALAMAFVILVREIDLSVGSTIAFTGMVCTLVANEGLGVFAIVCALIAGLLCGALNGFMVAKMRISSWIASLSMMIGLRAIVYIVTNQGAITLSNKTVQWFGAQKLLGFSVMVPIFLLVLFLCMFLLRHTRLGVSIYAVGGNEEAARMMGLNAEKVKILAYCMNGLLCAVGGIMLCSRLNTAQATAGESWETYAIASCALGGIKLTGGEGKISGVFFGWMIIVVILTLFNYAANINTWWQNILMGALVLAAVSLQADLFKLGKRNGFVRRKLDLEKGRG